MAGASQECLSSDEESVDSAISISLTAHSEQDAQYERQYSQEIEELRSSLEEKDEVIKVLEEELKRFQQGGIRELTRRVEELERRVAIPDTNGEEDTLKRKLEEKEQLIKELQLELEAARQTVSELQLNRAQCHTCECVDGAAVVEEVRCVTNWEFVTEANGTLKVLGNGAYGTVYEGVCKTTGKRVAIKAMKPPGPDDQEIKQMTRNILSEISMLSTLAHHHRIVSYLGASYRPHPVFKLEHLFVITEFMQGGSLRDYIRKRARGLSDDVDKIRAYTRQILEGVCFLHEHEPVVLHRDIKGGNILMDKTLTCIKLADFGCAKEVLMEHSEHTSKTSNMYGTIAWAAPEVLRQEKAYATSDIWSVAATVVEMFTGKAPYRDTCRMSMHQILMQVGSGRVNPMKTKCMQEALANGSVTDDLKGFLDACFKFEASERPSAATLLSDYSFCQAKRLNDTLPPAE